MMGESLAMKREMKREGEEKRKREKKKKKENRIGRTRKKSRNTLIRRGVIIFTYNTKKRGEGERRRERTVYQREALSGILTEKNNPVWSSRP